MPWNDGYLLREYRPSDRMGALQSIVKVEIHWTFQLTFKLKFYPTIKIFLSTLANENYMLYWVLSHYLFFTFIYRSKLKWFLVILSIDLPTYHFYAQSSFPCFFSTQTLFYCHKLIFSSMISHSHSRSPSVIKSYRNNL